MHRDEDNEKTGIMRLGTTTKLTSTNPTPVTSAALGEKAVRIICDGAGWIAIGAAPTATNADVYMNATEEMEIQVDVTDKISFLAATGPSSCYITGLS